MSCNVMSSRWAGGGHRPPFAYSAYRTDRLKTRKKASCALATPLIKRPMGGADALHAEESFTDTLYLLMSDLPRSSHQTRRSEPNIAPMRTDAFSGVVASEGARIPSIEQVLSVQRQHGALALAIEDDDAAVRPSQQTRASPEAAQESASPESASPESGGGGATSADDPTIPMEDDDILRLNPLLETFDFDDASAATRTLCCLPSQDGGKRQYAIPNKLFERLKTFDGVSTCAEIRQQWIDRGEKAQWQKLKRFVSGYCLPKRILVDVDSVELVAESPETRASYMAVQIPLLPAWFVDRVAACFAWLFNRSIAVPTALTASLILGAFLLTDVAAESVNLGVGGFAVVAALVVVGALIHEVGHATAGHRYDCSGIEIGCGWYIYFPVLYTDLSDTWKLPRMQRAVVDIAGLYFQGVFLAVLVTLFMYTGNPVYSHAVMLSGFSIVAALNPFLRLDGYWLLSDLGGIANLRQQSQQLLIAIGRWVAGDKEDAWMGVSGWSSVVLVVYTAFSSLFFAWLGWRVADMFIVGLVTSYPDRILEVINIAQSNVSLQGILVVALPVVWKTVFFVIVGRFGYLLIQRAVSAGKSAVSWLQSDVAGTALPDEPQADHP